MGEVYRARDTRLEREVAVKVLPAEFASDAERLRRFEKEARSASALNHPNIVTIYEIGSERDVSYIAMERVEGSTLREFLVGGPMAVRKLLAVATQITEGLSKAHEAGIVHRDLKPENVMMTRDGIVKILDFGVAKLTRNTSGDGGDAALPTMTKTAPGIIVGTVGYMSPEQARGEALDFRSDQFSFGSILYEMATGRSAFQKKTGIDTLAAILNEEPEPIASITPQIPAPVRWIVERCLEKDPERRYASTKDLARDLASLRDHLSEASLSLAVVGAAARRRWVAPGLGVALLLAVGLAAGRTFFTRPPTIPRFQQVTFRRGVTWGARFAPDGQTIIYAGAWEGRPYELFTTRVGGPESRSLGFPSANLLAISPGSELALQLLPSNTLARVPLAGGAPREVLEAVKAADWSPDGQTLAVIHVVPGRNRVELPIGKVLYETSRNLSQLRVSPRGDLVIVPGVGVLDAAGHILPKPTIGQDPVWSRDGKEIWFLKGNWESAEIHATSLVGSERVVTRVPGSFRLDDLSQDGRLLMERVIGANEILGSGEPGTPELRLSWLSDGVPAGLSADGRRLLISGFDRDEAYLRPTDGSPAIRLGPGRAVALSSDGSWAVVLEDEVSGRLSLVPTGAGEPRTVDLKGLKFTGDRFGGAAFFPDGKRLLIAAEQAGHRPRLFAVSLDGGEPRPVTPEGFDSVPIGDELIAPNGKTLVVDGPDGLVLFDLEAPNASPTRIPGLTGREAPIRWSGDGGALFVEEPRGTTMIVSRLDPRNGEKRLMKELRAIDPAGVLGAPNALITPDGKFCVYSYWRDLSDLFVVDGLR
jgi:Tol biopolymer transport system component